MRKEKEFHVAPMLDVSTIEFLNFFRLLTKRAILWTEMVVDETLVHVNLRNEDDPEELNRLLPYEPHLNLIVCQIGGIDPVDTAKAMQLIVNSSSSAISYDEVNLNIDCPSNRVSVQKQFGAILMHHYGKACDIVTAMCDNSKVYEHNKSNVSISVKTRVGIELESGEVYDSLDHLIEFTSRLRERGCRKFIIHARKCAIGGLLTPAQNRIISPLIYPRVYELCSRFPDCEFILNEGIPGL